MLSIVTSCAVCYRSLNLKYRSIANMPDIPRLNGVIKGLEEGKTAFASFTRVDAESAISMASASLDGSAFEMEHAALDFPGLRQALQAMLDRRQIVEGKTL